MKRTVRISPERAVASAGYDACTHGQVILVPDRVNLMTTVAGRAMPRRVTRRVFGFAGEREQ